MKTFTEAFIKYYNKLDDLDDPYYDDLHYLESGHFDTAIVDVGEFLVNEVDPSIGLNLPAQAFDNLVKICDKLLTVIDPERDIICDIFVELYNNNPNQVLTDLKSNPNKLYKDILDYCGQ